MTEGELAVEAVKEKYTHVRATFDANADDARALDMLDPGGERHLGVGQRAQGRRTQRGGATAEAHVAGRAVSAWRCVTLSP